MSPTAGRRWTTLWDITEAVIEETDRAYGETEHSCWVAGVVLDHLIGRHVRNVRIVGRPPRMGMPGPLVKKRKGGQAPESAAGGGF